MGGMYNQESLGGEERAEPQERGIAKVRYSHDGMIDMIVQNPWISQNDLAHQFGYTAAWVSTIMQSDAFQARMAARREEIVDPMLKVTLEERFKAMVTRSLEVLQQKLSAPAACVPDDLVLKAVGLGAKALGLGGNAPPPVVAPVADRLEILAHRLIELQTRTNEAKMVDVEATIVDITEVVQNSSD